MENNNIDDDFSMPWAVIWVVIFSAIAYLFLWGLNYNPKTDCGEYTVAEYEQKEVPKRCVQ